MSLTLRRITLVLGAIALLGILPACTEEDPESCDSTRLSCGASVQTCCTATSCAYTFNGTRYPCSGTNCNSAASQVARAACGSVPNPSAATGDAASLLGVSRLAAEAACTTVLP
jgi:hypothetical protein